jgi:hypothetical protein
MVWLTSLVSVSLMVRRRATGLASLYLMMFFRPNPTRVLFTPEFLPPPPPPPPAERGAYADVFFKHDFLFVVLVTMTLTKGV